MKIIVTAGLSDYKLSTKLIGLVENDSIDKILLVRKKPLTGSKKIQNINPPFGALLFTPFYEIWRLFTIIKHSKENDISAIVGIQLIIHGLQARIAGWLTRTPVILSLIGKDVHRYLASSLGRILFGFLVKTANCITVMGNESKRIVRDIGASYKKVFILQNYQDIDKFYFQNVRKEYDIIYVGQLISRKRVNDLIYAISRIENKFNVVIVGRGIKHNYIKSIAKELSLIDRITFAGEVNNVEDYLNRSRLLVLPSDMEALPAVAIEAMYCGTPAILPNICDIPTYFGHGSESVLFTPGDVDDLSEKIKHILLDEFTYTKRVNACLEWAKQHTYEWSELKQIESWRRILAVCINR